MNNRVLQRGVQESLFRPSVETERDHFTGSGQRKQVEAREALPMRWPKGRKEQQLVLEAWQDVAMQIIHEAGGRYRLIAAIWRLIIWKEGHLYATNKEIAKRTGGCSDETIKQDIAQYKALGIIAVGHGWRKKGGRWVRSKTIRPAIPSDLSGRQHRS